MFFRQTFFLLELANYLSSLCGLAFLNTTHNLSRSHLFVSGDFFFLRRDWAFWIHVSGFPALPEAPLPETSSTAGRREGQWHLLPEKSPQKPVPWRGSCLSPALWPVAAVVFLLASPQLQAEFPGPRPSGGWAAAQCMQPGPRGCSLLCPCACRTAWHMVRGVCLTSVNWKPVVQSITFLVEQLRPREGGGSLAAA